MDEINKNLKKLQEEVSEINHIFQKQNNIVSSSINYNNEYLKLLNNNLVRIIILFCLFCSILYFLKPEFCYEEIINEHTHFKEKELRKSYITMSSILLTAFFFYFTINLKI